jgi:hypothetical protein
MKIVDEILSMVETISFKTKKLKKYEKILYKTVISFYMKQLGVNNITINVFSERSKNGIGSITLSDIVDKEYKMYVDFTMGFDQVFEAIAHEMTHIKQISKKELVKKGDEVFWKNKLFLSVADFKKANKTLASHGKMPFEKEAKDNAEVLRKQFIGSREFKNLAKEDPTLAFIIDNT